MERARPRRTPVESLPRTTAPSATKTLFPGAVAGEQYDRYVKSVHTQAQRWLSAHWFRASQDATTAIDVRQKLRAVAAVDINRHLYPQEEQLLSEIVHAAWDARAGATGVPHE